MSKITKGVLDGTHESWKTRFKALWNEGEVKELLQQLHTQQSAISVLVGLLQMDSLSEIKRLVRRNEALLQEIAYNTRKSLSTYSIDAPQSIYEMDDGGGSIYSKLVQDQDVEEPASKDLDVEKSALEESFESALLNSKVYSKAVKDIFGLANDESDGEKTVTNVGLNPVAYVDGLLDVETLSNISRPSLPVSRFISYKESFLDAKTNLHVTSVHASVRKPYAVTRPGELTFSGKESVTKIQKINKYWYWEEVARTDNEAPLQDRLFERSQVVFGFGLYKPLSVRAKNTYTGEGPDTRSRLTFEKGEQLEITRIHHTVLWLGRHLPSKKGMRTGYVKVDDIELEDHAQKNVNVLLDFFSCPHPEFLGASGQERMTAFIGLHRRSGIMERLYAHCRSFAELQTLQRSIEECSQPKPNPSNPSPWSPDWSRTDSS